MKTLLNTVLLVFAFVTVASGQTPVITAITGPNVVCSAPSAPNTFIVVASNFPTAYSWNVSPSVGVMMTGAGAVRTISFPNTNLTYTIYCTSANSSGPGNTFSITVQVFETPTVTFSGNNFSFCQGSATNLSASSTLLYSASSSLSYSWTPSTGLNTTTGPTVIASPPNTTTYNVQVTLGFCINTYQVTVIALQNPVINVSTSKPVICAGESAVISVTGNANNYFFNFLPTMGAETVSPGVTTTYTVSGSNGKCETFATITQVVDPCVGIKTQAADAIRSLQLYPNPSNGTFILRSSNTERISIFTELGQVIRQVDLISNEETEVRALPPGIYYVSARFSKTKLVVTD